jgi:hypothetical protein
LFGGGQHQQQQQKQPQQQEVELPDVHTKDPHEEANVIRKALRIKVTEMAGSNNTSAVVHLDCSCQGIVLRGAIMCSTMCVYSTRL